MPSSEQDGEHSSTGLGPRDRDGAKTRAVGFSVCVYCGSRPGADPRFAAEARALGEALAVNGLRLVYGAGDAGLMGAVSNACRARGGEAFGVIPRGLFDRELSNRPSSGVAITQNLHQRKALMLENADAVAVLPGGVGTLDELVEAVTWRQLGLHAKPIVLIDIGGFWSPLLDMFARMAESGFLHAGVVDQFHRVEGAAAAVAKLLALTPRNAP